MSIAKFKCDQEGCLYESEIEQNLRQHKKMKHGILPEGKGPKTPPAPKTEHPKDIAPESADEEWRPPEVKLPKANVFPVDPFDRLRMILHNNNCDRWREATISLFQNYDPMDFDGLLGVMADQNIPPIQRDMVMKTYKASMGVKEEPEEEDADVPTERGKGKKSLPRDPTQIPPVEIMAMSPTELRQLEIDAMRYERAAKFQERLMDRAYGNTVGGPGGNGQYPPEVQAMLNEYKEMKEQQRLEKMMAPVYQLMQKLDQQQQQPKAAGSNFDDIYQKAMALKLLDGLGNSKEVDALRQEAQNRLEQQRMSSDERIAQINADRERLKEEQNRIVLESMRRDLTQQIASLQTQTQHSPPEALASQLENIIKLNEAINKFTGAGAGTPAKVDTLQLLESVGKNFGPGIEQALKIVGKKLEIDAVRAGVPPLPPAPGDLEAPVEAITCSKCGTLIPIVGRPPLVQCPKCGSQYAPGPDQPSVEQARPPASQQVQPAPSRPRYPEPVVAKGEPPSEPTDEEILAEMKRLPREQLDQIAINRGINPSIYLDKDQLAEELFKMRK